MLTHETDTHKRTGLREEGLKNDGTNVEFLLAKLRLAEAETPFAKRQLGYSSDEINQQKRSDSLRNELTTLISHSELSKCHIHQIKKQANDSMRESNGADANGKADRGLAIGVFYPADSVKCPNDATPFRRAESLAMLHNCCNVTLSDVTGILEYDVRAINEADSWLASKI